MENICRAGNFLMRHTEEGGFQTRRYISESLLCAAPVVSVSNHALGGEISCHRR
jgi:hypothetical protein